MNRILLPVLIVLPVLALTGDGISVRKWLTHGELTAVSRWIFTATVVKTGHIHAVREAYGRQNRYISRYRLLVRIDRMLKGDPLVDGGKPEPCWLELSSNYIPGKWLLLEEAYRNGTNPGQVKTGEKLLVYTSYRNGRTFHLRGLDPVTLVAATEAQLKKQRPDLIR